MQEGLLREFARKGDAFHDVMMMALLRKKWPPAQKLTGPPPAAPRKRRFPDVGLQPPGEE